jgi:hypothetical protein
MWRLKHPASEINSPHRNSSRCRLSCDQQVISKTIAQWLSIQKPVRIDLAIRLSIACARYTSALYAGIMIFTSANCILPSLHGKRCRRGNGSGTAKRRPHGRSRASGAVCRSPAKVCRGHHELGHNSSAYCLRHADAPTYPTASQPVPNLAVWLNRRFDYERECPIKMR